MKRQLELETLEERRHSLRLILLYKVVEGLVLELPTADFVTTAKAKMNIKAKVYKECETTNIIERRLIKNSKGIKVPDCNTVQSKHSFLVETIVHWNQLPDKVVCADSRGAPPPLKLEKNMLFWRKIVIFHTKYPKIFRASLRNCKNYDFLA